MTSSGTWSLTLVDASSETQTEPNTGDDLTINIPAGGVTFTSSFLSGCTITAKASTPTGTYNDTNTATFNGAPIGVTLNGCFGVTGSTVNMSGSFATNINIGDLTT